MTGPASGSDARKYRGAESADAFSYTGVQVGRARRFQFRLAAWLERQSAEAVCNEEDDFAGCFFAQFPHECMHDHSWSFSDYIAQSTDTEIKFMQGRNLPAFTRTVVVNQVIGSP